jgi:leader peptidase (prepilin peptidase) / N-methyltransferase
MEPWLAVALPLWFLVAVTFPLVRTDLREHRLPNKFTYPAILLAILGTSLASILTGDYSRLVLALGLNLGITLIGLLLVRYAGFGMGDVKLLIAQNQVLGYLSPWLVLVSLVVALVVSSSVGLIAILLKRIKWQDRIAFGPYLLTGYLICALPFGLQPDLY